MTDISFPIAKTVGVNAFRADYAIKEANFPEAISLGAAAFMECEGMTDAVFPKVTTCLATSGVSKTFSFCLSLSSIDMPSLETIQGDECFN